MTEAHDQLRLSISPDRRVASMIVPPGLKTGSLTAIGIQAVLDTHGISPARRRAGAVAEVLSHHEAKPGEPCSVVMATALDPQHAQDGRVELDPSVAPAGATGKLGPVVIEGQVLARVVPPTVGADGMDLYGKTLTARTGKDAAPRLDDSVILKGDAITCQHAGLLSFINGRLRVLPDAELDSVEPPGVEFPGNLSVRRGIGDSVTIRLRGNLSVGGSVDAATIEVGGNAILSRGMAARDVGKLKIGGSLTAHYLSSVEASIGGDLVIDKEVVASKVSVEGSCRSPRIAVVGGFLSVAKTCELGELGSEAWTVTEVALGRSMRVERLLAEAASLLPQAIANEADKAAQLQTLQTAAPRPSHDQAETTTELVFSRENARAAVQKLRAATNTLCTSYRAARETRLIVHERLHAGAHIFAGQFELVVRQTIRGPVELTLDASGRPCIRDAASKSALPEGVQFTVAPSDRFCDPDAVQKAAA